MRMTWKGWRRMRRWKASLPQVFTRYLLAQMRPVSRASEEICSHSLEMRCTHRGNSSTLAFLRARSKMRIFGSGTPRQKRDLG
uniref:Putative secreted protein n=1 Tax=Ixodes ricinus TaxID=34613 RepID=A0A6B0U7Z7_IXORI